MTSAVGDPAVCQCHLSTSGRFPGCPIHDPRPYGQRPEHPVEELPASFIVIPPAPTKGPGRYECIGAGVGQLVDEKNAAYGGSFRKAGDFFRLLYPDGIRPEQYDDALVLARMFDKMMRIATHKDALGESPYHDLAGYGLLGTTL